MVTTSLQSFDDKRRHGEDVRFLFDAVPDWPDHAIMPPHGTLRPSGRRRAFGSRVLGLVALTTVPLLVLTAFIAQRAAHDSEARVTADRVALARAAALTLSSFVDAQTAAVQALTPTPDVSDPFTRPDLPGFLRRALGSHPQWEEIDLI